MCKQNPQASTIFGVQTYQSKCCTTYRTVTSSEHITETSLPHSEPYELSVVILKCIRTSRDSCRPRLLITALLAALFENIDCTCFHVLNCISNALPLSIGGSPWHADTL